MTELVLHMGLPKTGTSALQVGFVKNRDVLLANGVLYPESYSDAAASKGLVTSGNGLDLARFVVPRLPHRDGADPSTHVDELVSVLQTATVPVVLYSSEWLIFFKNELLEALLDRLRGHCTIRCVLHVRNIAGHALSEYSQAVKRGRYTGSFRDFIDPDLGGSYAPKFSRLPALMDLVGSSNVTLIHYDSVRDRLLRHFTETVLGFQLGPGHEGVGETINRSLTEAELQLMRRVNERLETKQGSTFISDRMIRIPPLGQDRPGLTADELGVLRRRFQRGVDLVNETGLVAGQLTVESPDVVTGDRPVQPDLTPREQFLIELLSLTPPK